MECEAGDGRGVGKVSDVVGAAVVSAANGSSMMSGGRGRGQGRCRGQRGDHGGGEQVSAATCGQGDAKAEMRVLVVVATSTVR